MEVTMSAYIKNFVSPENWSKTIDIMYNKNKDFDFFTKFGELIKDNSFVKKSEIIAEIFTSLIVYETNYYFTTKYADSYPSVEELDNFVYYFVGSFIKEGLNINCLKDFINDIIQAKLNDKSIKQIIRDYKNKDCKKLNPMTPSSFPKSIDGRI